MALSICFSRLSLSLIPPHLCSHGGARLSRALPAPTALHFKKNAALSSSFAGSTLSLAKNVSLISIPTQKHSKLAVFAKKKGYKMKTHKASAKRFKVTGKGKIVRRRAGKQHLLAKKNTKRKKRLSKLVQVNKSDYDNVISCMPYLKVNRKVN